MLYMGSSPEFGEKAFHSGDGETVPRRVEPDEECAVGIAPSIQILKQMDLCSGVKVDSPLLVAFAEHHAFSFIEINVGAVQVHQFAHADPGGDEQVDDRKIAGVTALVAQAFQIFVGERFFDELRDLNLVDAADRAFAYIVFIFEPCEKRRHDPADVVHRNLAGIPHVLICGKIKPDVVCLDGACVFLDRVEHV